MIIFMTESMKKQCLLWESLFFHPASGLIQTLKGIKKQHSCYHLAGHFLCLPHLNCPWTCYTDVCILHDDVSTCLDSGWVDSPHLCVVTPLLLQPSLSPTSAARFLPHFNPDASAPIVGQTPSPEEDTVIRDLLPEDAGIDHQTVHQLIMVLMKFMAKDQSSAEADIGSAKAFNTVKRHLYVLLGYDQQEGCFMIAPQKMRTSTCFNAFIAGIAQVTDI